MKLKQVLLHSAFFIAPFAIVTPAHAAVVVSGSDTISASSLTAPNRIFRNGAASQWGSAKTYPGTASSGSFAYAIVNGTFAANAVQKIFYEISYTNLIASAVFSTAYLNAFNAADLGSNYLGDSGSSPTATSTPTYQVAVDVGQSLLVHFGAVQSGATGQSYGYTINAYSDANRGENFLPVSGAVPEPATWAMMILGMGAIGFAMRRRKSKVTTAVAYA